jgi:hypothetical protein
MIVDVGRPDNRRCSAVLLGAAVRQQAQRAGGHRPCLIVGLATVPHPAGGTSARTIRSPGSIPTRSGNLSAPVPIGTGPEVLRKDLP